MAPGGLVEVCVSWPGHPRYLKKKNESPICKKLGKMNKLKNIFSSKKLKIFG